MLMPFEIVSLCVCVAGYGFGSPGISTTDVVIGLFYICK